MPLETKHLRELASSCRNLAQTAHDAEAREALAELAANFERRAELRAETIKAVREQTSKDKSAFHP